MLLRDNARLEECAIPMVAALCFGIVDKQKYRNDRGEVRIRIHNGDVPARRRLQRTRLHQGRA
jgi:hypothetical protein